MTRIIDGQYVDFNTTSDVIAEMKAIEPLVGEVADDQELRTFVFEETPGRYDELTRDDLDRMIDRVLTAKLPH
jgi:hypothetical protein